LESLVYQSTRPAGLRVRPADGTGNVEELARGLGLHACSCSPDGEVHGTQRLLSRHHARREVAIGQTSAPVYAIGQSEMIAIPLREILP
jgi:hypothetical protein